MAWYDSLDAGHTVTHELEIGLRLVLAAAAGAAIGFERETKDRPAGLRTNMLVALAAGLFTIITFKIYHAFKGANADPIRIIEAVTAGVAFLAAGTIIQGKASVHGLTTGAAMWMSGALGRVLWLWILRSRVDGGYTDHCYSRDLEPARYRRPEGRHPGDADRTRNRSASLKHPDRPD